MGAGGFSPREAALLPLMAATGPEARLLRLRVAAAAVVDHLVGSDNALRLKVSGRSQEKKAVEIRKQAWAALELAGYNRREIALVFNRDPSVVFRANELALACPQIAEEDPEVLLERRAAAEQIEAELERLAGIAEAPPAGTFPFRARPAPSTLASGGRRAYEAVVDKMIVASSRGAALAIWRRWCRREYPWIYEGAVATLPRRYRLRLEAQLSRGLENGAALPEDQSEKCRECDTVTAATSTSGHCETGTLRDVAERPAL